MKPRIFFQHGYWRVSLLPRARTPVGMIDLWVRANTFVAKLNNRRHGVT